MYRPSTFAETDQSTLFDLIERYSFGALISQHDGEPLVSHLPFLVERETGPHGRLIGHMARANPQWRQADGQTALVVFRGPHAYISPRWYNGQDVVPTWNYVVVHAHGRLRAIHDAPQVLEIVARTVERYESSRPAPWNFDPSTEFATRLAGEIVGFEIELSRLEGKWKLSQNHSIQRQRSVISALRQSGDGDSREIARLMAANLDSIADCV